MITGATSGVGRATARAFAKRGNRVGLLARGAEALKATRSELKEMGADGVEVPVDVADPGAVDAAADTVERELGPIAIWVSNAMTAVTYLGVAHGSLSALRRMFSRDVGKIVQVGSAGPLARLAESP